MYIADAFGYLGTVLVLLIKEFSSIQHGWVDFFTRLFYISAGAGVLLVIWAAILYGAIYRKTIN